MINPRIVLSILVAFSSDAYAESLTVDTSSKTAVTDFYRSYYCQGDKISSGWAGDVAAGNEGTISESYKEATKDRVNFYRAMAGVPAGVVLRDDWNAKAQKAALMMSANGELNHFPPTSWTHFSADGAEAAGKSNLSLEHGGPVAVMDQMKDDGDSNFPVGHRRWILFPPATEMGVGTVDPKSGYSAAAALWVVQDNPDAGVDRTKFAAWPPPGFVPHSLIYSRWSFSYPGADFSNASVSVTANAAPPSVVTLETFTDGYGDNALVFKVKDSKLAKPGKDRVYVVTVSNVLVEGVSRTFEYTVTQFNAEQALTKSKLAFKAKSLGGGLVELLAFVRDKFGCFSFNKPVLDLFWSSNGSSFQKIGSVKGATAALRVQTAGYYKYVLRGTKKETKVYRLIK